MSGRVVVVLGYSDGGLGELHPVGAARVARAAELSTADDVVVLSGWARVPGTHAEADLMRLAWSGAAAEVLLDPDARSTVENARHAVAVVRTRGATEVVVVTSRWHARRAAVAFRVLLRGSGIAVSAAWPEESRNVRARLRELAVWPLLPAQLALRRRGAQSSSATGSATETRPGETTSPQTPNGSGSVVSRSPR